MNGQLYMNISDKRVVKKNKSNKKTITTSNGRSVTLHFKDDSNIIRPTIMLSRNIDIEKYNYLYVGDKINRFYYIDSYDVSQQYYILHCSVDVLMSFQKDILKQDCIIKRQANHYDAYLDDDKFVLRNISRIQLKRFPHGFKVDGYKTASFVLVVNGSGSSAPQSNVNGGD